MRDVTVEAVKAVLAQSLGLPEGEGTGEESLHDAFAMDSVALLEFVVALEKTFSISIEEEWLDMEHLLDFPALADYIRQRSHMGTD
jgi:acyl carrier protein